MSEIRQYLFTLISAATIAALAISITGKKGLIPSVIKLLTGLFLTVYIIYPLVKTRFIDISDILSDVKIDSMEITQNGKDLAAEAVTDIIKDKVEAYILDKAVSMNCELQVEVFMNDANPPCPDSVIIQGNISPYQKQTLIKMINDDIGIPKEKQQWN